LLHFDLLVFLAITAYQSLYQSLVVLKFIREDGGVDRRGSLFQREEQMLAKDLD